MNTYVAFLNCPNGHNLLASPFEAESEADEAAFFNHFRWMTGQYNKEIAAGTMPPACPFCGAPNKDFTMHAQQLKGSLSEFHARTQAKEAANIERARQAMRRKLN